MISNDRIVQWSDEAAAEGDMILATLLLHLATLRNVSDHRALEILKNYAGMRVRDGVQGEDVWPELIDG